MLLALDIGNTHTVAGLFDGDTLVHDFRIESSTKRTLDEFHVLLRSLVQLSGVAPEDVDASIIASVVPPLTDRLSAAVEGAFAVTPLIVGPGIRSGVKIRYENPREVGADRIVNAVAAFELVRQAVIVVDFGTATTFDCINQSGDYLGGAIAPGMQISADALFSRAARLPRTDLTAPKSAIGRRTDESMRAGIVYGYAALVDGLAARLIREMDADTRVIATGGLASLIQPHTDSIESVHPTLTLDGLRLLYQRNV